MRQQVHCICIQAAEKNEGWFSPYVSFLVWEHSPWNDATGVENEFSQLNEELETLPQKDLEACSLCNP